MKTLQVAIIGGGPNCTYALERLAALARSARLRTPIALAIFDRTGAFGSGAIHDPLQSRSNYLNRVASQIAFAADESIAGEADLLPRGMRPNFYEWARQELEAGRLAHELRPNDVPRRFLHGRALRDAFQRYASLLEESRQFMLECVPKEVVDIDPDDSGGFRIFCTGEESPRTADYLLLVTGHGDNRGGEEATGRRWPCRYVSQPYPVEKQLNESAVSAGSTVGMMGMGLTAIDAILHLTEGRGGTFTEHGRRTVGRRSYSYRRSGREPARILPFSPSGLFTFCRPSNQKASDGSGIDHRSREHQPLFLTTDALESLRRSKGRPGLAGGRPIRQIDFERDVFPLVILELAFVYHSILCPEAAAKAAREAAPRYRQFLAGQEPVGIEAADWLVEPLDCSMASKLSLPAASPFDWRQLFNPVSSREIDGDLEWRRRLLEFMRQDLVDAAQGNLGNPRKGAVDAVWRDLRHVLAGAIDFGGLTPDSHRRFIDTRLRDYNRLSNGAGEEAMAKLVALVEDGLVDVSCSRSPRLREGPEGACLLEGCFGGATFTLDQLIEARAHPFDAANDGCPLYRNMMRRGLLRLWVNEGAPGDEPFVPGAIDVGTSYHPRDAAGSEDHRITILGAPLERAAFFQLTAARPHSGSQVLKSVDAWARQMLRAAAEPLERSTGLASSR